MKTTKTIITAILLCFFAFASAQQKKELTKEETVKYINDLFSKSYVNINSETKIKYTAKSVTIDGKTLTIKFDKDGTENSFHRIYLMDYKVPLYIIKGESYIDKTFVGEYSIKDNSDKTNILWFISLEDDAKRLKNALEHLIKLLKAEPETDPFAN